VTTKVQVRGGETLVSDGPYAETKDLIGGIAAIECAHLDGKIREAGIPYRVPPAHLLTERLNAVLAVVYLLFNEGYAASAGAELVRQNLSAEAIRLARLRVRLLPEPEARSLLAKSEDFFAAMSNAAAPRSSAGRSNRRGSARTTCSAS